MAGGGSDSYTVAARCASRGAARLVRGMHHTHLQRRFAMGGPIVRFGSTPEYWNNWDRVFAKGGKAAAAKSTGSEAGSGKKTAKSAAVEPVKKTEPVKKKTGAVKKAKPAKKAKAAPKKAAPKKAAAKKPAKKKR
ncbi:MAG: hypothetical protein K1X74_02610 [Pirellulales bacterium]|nr:hypothetical protein [Pirellulales bacterium]